MSITSMNARMGMAEKLSIQQLTKAVQEGTVPSFIGIPLIQEKMKEKTAAGAMQQQQPPVAQQVMQQAMATEGVQALPSNMPQEYAQGGILHYAEGDLVDDEDYDEMLYDDQMSEAQKQISKIRDEMMSEQATRSAEMPSASYGGIDYAEAPNPQVEYRRTPTAELAKVSKGTPSNFESMALARGKAHGVDEHLVRHVMHKETGGLKDRANAVSPAGAIGVMQLMPGTAKDLGVRNPYDPEQNIEGGVKYLAQLQRKYQDPKLAAIAYNWGPGNTDKWLAAGADPSRLPRETRGYIQNLAQGGIAGLAGGGAVKHFQYGGISSVAPFSAAGLSEADLTRMAQMGEQSAIDELASREARAAKTLRDAQTGRAGINPNYRATPTPNYVNPQALKAAAAPATGGSALGAGAALSGIPLLGSLFSYGAANKMRNQSPEELEQMEGFGADPSGTSFAAAIMRQAKMNDIKKAEAAAPAKPVNDQPRLSQIYNDQRALGNTALGKREPLGNIDLGFGPNQYSPSEPAKVAEESKEPASSIDSSMSDIQEIKDLLKTRGEGLSKQKDIDNYMSLLSAGLGMMGGTSPFAAANIGQGAQAGISHALQASRGRAADENALLSGRLGLYKYQQSAETNKQNKEYLQDYRKENIRLKELGLSDAKAKAVAEQDIKKLALHKDRLGALEKSANAIALSRLKSGFTDAERDKAIADSIARLHNDPGYQEDYRAIYGRLPYSGQASTQNVRKFDNKFGTQ